ncbi:Melanopsin [Holothuria leucospilota]|uniref:Melanopsin n=1 Tax=Holothuria leucospilota TaxID=206669 RepID=A0A9Q1HDV4_HOLLE|nr:Melanopsin [Holothuria leucospilota]
MSTVLCVYEVCKLVGLSSHRQVTLVNVKMDPILQPSSEHIALGAIDLFLAIIAMFGNGMIILAVSLSSCLQTSANVFVINLAITDFLLALAAVVYSLSFWTQTNFTGLEIICAIAVAFAQTCVGCSIFTLASISVNRYLLVCKPRKIYELIFRRRVIALWIVTIWVLSSAATVLPLPFMIGELGFDEENHQCDAISSQELAAIYDHILAVAYFPIPLVVVIFCYTNIYLYVRRHNKQLRKQLDEQLPENSSSTAPTSERRSEHEDSPAKRRMSVKQIQITKNLFLIFCVFIVCLTPHALCSFIGCASHYTRTLVALNSLINPFVYGISHPYFRKVFVNLLKCKPVPEPSAFASWLYNLRSSHHA